MSQITTHILDTSIGKPAQGIQIELFHQLDSQWNSIGTGITNSDGRVADLLQDSKVLPGGVYKLVFLIENYFSAQHIFSFYPYVEIVFQISEKGEHYHVPLLLNPFGYSTYRGS